VLALADELSGLLQSLDTAGQEAARGFYLTGWSGTGSYSFDRIGRGSITLSRYCLSVFGGFQPDRIRAYVQFAQRGNSRNDGLLQRFQLIVWPDPLGTVTLVDRAPNHAAMNRYQQAVLNLPNLDQTQLQGAQRLANGSQLLHFSSTAQQIFYEWYVENERLLAIGGLDSARQSHFAKYRSLVPALALLFHLLDGETDGVCDDCLTRAIGFTEYLKKHANRIYASVSGHDHAATRTLATRLLDGQLSDGFTCRTLALKGWSGLATKEQTQAAIDALVDFDWLFEEEIRSGGRPTVRYTLNPSVTSDLL
jgi:putative DNA primase/helicase